MTATRDRGDLRVPVSPEV